MTNNELLLAISNMMDQKLKAELQPIQDELKLLREDMQDLKEDVQILKEEVQILKEKVEILREEVDNLKERVLSLEHGFHQMRLIQENQILPRLNTIESCYTSTYDRYKKDADKMESVYEDTQLLKKVVTEHSQKLQKLA